MRCNKCNVDIGEEYKYCPLCGEKADDSPAVLQGFRTAEFPDVKHRPYPRNYPKLYFIFYICICAFACAAEWIFRSGEGIELSPYLIFAGPAVWAVALRPFLVKRLYFGSHVYRAVLYSSPLVLWLSYTIFGITDTALEAWLPMLFAFGILLIFIGLFAARKRVKNSLMYLLGFLFFSLVLLALNLINGLSALPSIICIVLTVTTFTTAFILEPKKCTDELAARFHI